MIKKLFYVIKRIIIACIFIYTYDFMALPLNIIIPINFINVLLVSIFGIPAMFGLVFFSFVF